MIKYWGKFQGAQDDLSGLLCEALIWRMEELRPNVVRELFACLPLIAHAGEKGPSTYHVPYWRMNLKSRHEKFVSILSGTRGRILSFHDVICEWSLRGEC